jgi:hypothetical protein
MATDRPPKRLLVVLGVLLVTLAGVVAYNLSGSEQAAPPAATSNPPRPTRGRQTPVTTAQELDLRIEALSQVKPAPEESDRNPFRFRPPPPPPAQKATPTEPEATTPPPPPPPPPLPPESPQAVATRPTTMATNSPWTHARLRMVAVLSFRWDPFGRA